MMVSSIADVCLLVDDPRDRVGFLGSVNGISEFVL
jgi:hypothetical protein